MVTNRAHFRIDNTMPTEGDDVLMGTFSGDTISGLGGNDVIYGLDGNDTLGGDDGNDVLVGGRGNDQLTGGAGNDHFVFDGRQFGLDTIVDFFKGDKIDVGALGIGDYATLTYTGGGGPLINTVGNDVVISAYYNGVTEKITITGGAGKIDASSFVFDTSHNPLVLNGTFSNDEIFGALGNDILSGGSGNDRLYGGEGDDILTGGLNTDTLIGAGGADKFRFDASDSSPTSPDKILDFIHADGDKIDLSPIDPSSAYGDQALKFVTGDFTDIGQVRFVQSGSDYLVQVNLSGDLNPDFVIQVTSDQPMHKVDLIL